MGSFLLAYIYSHFKSRGLLVFLGTGFLGGFTTFSTFIVENLNLALEEHVFISFLYIGLSLSLSIGACFLGWSYDKKFKYDQSLPYIFMGGLIGSLLRLVVFTRLDSLTDHKSDLIVIKANHVEGLF